MTNLFYQLIGRSRRTVLQRRSGKRSNPKRQAVLVLRSKYDKLGDLILFSGALRRIREFYRDAHISLGIPGAFLPVFEHCPYVDELIDLSTLTEPWSSHLAGILPRLRNPLICVRNAGRYDQILFVRRAPGFGDHELISSFAPVAAYGIGGDNLILSENENCRGDRFYNKRCPLSAADATVHDLEITRRYLNMIGLPITGLNEIWPEFWLTDEDRKLSRVWLENTGDTGLSIACGPVGSLEYRSWPYGLYNAVLAQFSPCTVILVGMPRDSPAAAEIMRSPGKGVRFINLMGQTSIREMFALIEACDAFIGVESAPIHAAIAMRKPTLGIMGGGHYQKFLPWGDPNLNQIATHKMDCFGCNWKCIHREMYCLTKVTSDEIVAKLKHALETSRENSSKFRLQKKSRNQK